MAIDSQADPKPTILVVDDSRLIRVAAKKILRDNFDVVEAEDGEVAWTHLQENPSLQVVMSDLSMPKLDGLDLLKRIRASDNPQLKTMPVIIATGAEDDDGSKEKALSAGANNFITKPFDSTELLASAKSLLKQQQISDALKESESTNIELKAKVDTDMVTGLYNQKAFQQHGEEHLAYAVRHHTELALLNIRLDRYKIYFLRRGKPFAEALLKKFADILSEDRRREDILAHLGHGEFALLLPSSDPIGTKYLADNLRKRIEQYSFALDDNPINATASIGIACPVLSQSSTFNGLFDDARQQLAAAVKDGGNAVRAISIAATHITDQLTPIKTRTHSAQPNEVAQALNALRLNSPLKGDIDSIIRAVMPLLDNWNNHHSEQHKQAIESIREALYNPEDTVVTRTEETTAFMPVKPTEPA